MHWEIFSNENLFSDKTEYGDYELINLTEINHYNRAEVIELCKDVLFKSYSVDARYSKYTKHLDKNAIAPIGIAAYYSTKYSEKARYVVLHNKSEWDANRDFVTEYSNSNQKGYTKIDNITEFNENNIRPFLWWDSEIDHAINRNLKVKIVNKSPFYYEPINFLLWLMKNDDELYKQICPKSYKDELEKQDEEFLAASALQRIAALGSMDAGDGKRENIFQMVKNYFDSKINKVKDYINSIKETHYTRNKFNNPPSTKEHAEQLVEEKLFIKMSETKDMYHELGVSTDHNPVNNDKYVSIDGHIEGIYDENGKLVTDPVNQGTYNFADPNNEPIEHFVKDVIPYYLWGNSPDDPTSFWERVSGTYSGSLNGE